ncbi:RNHCP domain-containing protein [Dictyobacter arantiisoli]|uniref:RNHCP domain-containing protein n=1 Tax=Dictyobacter arantiisoli TaxID=2014874 RepID=A0A5A5TJ16_9CHLR|nr:RNHCP domain-containing protein [Dictyobacter arantiisoli]GCF11407.1 hypothetical protein KDI_49710 [Dictyobacter arantiisoli]
MRITHKHTNYIAQQRHTQKMQRPRRQQRSTADVFKCNNCRRFIGPLPYGGHHRNHCPFCLFSRHVDERKGDRLNECGSRMEPSGYFQRPNGEYVLVHRCLGCAFERFNRIAGDDNFDLLLTLPLVAPRTSQDVKQQRLQRALTASFEESKEMESLVNSEVEVEEADW